MKLATALTLLSLSGIAQAHITLFEGTFAPEAPGATGTGTLSLEYDSDGHTLFIDANWAGLSGVTTNAHIHCCTDAPFTGTAGVALGDTSNAGNRLTDFPLGVTAGTYTKVIDLTNSVHFTSAFLGTSGPGGTPGTLAQAEARLIQGLASGNAYFNIHTETFTGGEIRTFVTVVPEASTWLMMALGLGLVGGVVRRRSVA